MTAREMIKILIKLDDLNTKIDFRLPIKFYGQDQDLLLRYNCVFYEDDSIIIGFNERLYV